MYPGCTAVPPNQRMKLTACGGRLVGKSDRDVWIQGSVAAGVLAEYGEMLRMLTETIASGMGSRPNDNVEKVSGAPPIKFADFARRTAQAWT